MPLKNNNMSKESQSAQGDKSRQVVLVVDDQPSCLTILEKIIEAQGMAVETASNGQEALALWAVKKHHIVITDCHMPQMDGYDLAKAIRQLEKTENISKSTIVALTANRLKDEEPCSTDAVIDEMMTKPVSNEQITALLTNGKRETSTNQHTKPPVVDLTVLAQIFPDTSKQFEILEGFQTHIKDDYLELQEHAQQNNLSGIVSITHRMKGACKMVGVNNVANICEKIETEAKNGVIVNDIIFSVLEHNIQAFTAYMSQHVHQTKTSTANPNAGRHA